MISLYVSRCKPLNYVPVDILNPGITWLQVASILLRPNFGHKIAGFLRYFEHFHITFNASTSPALCPKILLCGTTLSLFHISLTVVFKHWNLRVINWVIPVDISSPLKPRLSVSSLGPCPSSSPTSTSSEASSCSGRESSDWCTRSVRG